MISIDISCADTIFEKTHVLNDVTSDVMTSTCFPDVLQIKTYVLPVFYDVQHQSLQAFFYFLFAGEMVVDIMGHPVCCRYLLEEKSLGEQLLIRIFCVSFLEK